jgi:hypothetical protein
VSQTWRYPDSVPSRRFRSSSLYPIPGRTNRRASPNHGRSIRGTERNIPQSHIHRSSHATSSTRAGGIEADPIVISDDDKVVSDEETPSNMIQAEVDWHRQHRMNLAGNLWSVEPSEDR